MFAVVFIAEWGDLTQLGTGDLAWSYWLAYFGGAGSPSQQVIVSITAPLELVNMNVHTHAHVAAE